ncbi:MAG: hypothetical protein LH480_02270 [Rubrivivax sp.]|nr:hypothetical protein [Rubrivivax sp.]
MNRKTALDIAVAGTTAVPASPEQKRFKTLLDKIDKARARLMSWQQQTPLFAQAHQTRIAPLQAALDTAQRAWAFELEQVLLRGRWAKTDSSLLGGRIVALSGQLLLENDGDAELKALHDRHADTAFDAQSQQAVDTMRAFMESEGDFDFGTEPIASVDELLERAAQHRAQAQAARDAGQHGKPDRGPADGGATDGNTRQYRKAARKTKTSAERKAEAEAAQVSQTVREVYRKLASALHPDRAAADATPEQRQQRTERMATANSAYAAGDLLALLTLQLQIEQVDMARAAGMAAVQLKHVNKVLTEQLRELDNEIDDRQDALCASYGFRVDKRLDPERLSLLIKEQLQHLQYQQMQLQFEQRVLRGDTAQAKRWLKQVCREQRQQQRLGGEDFF